MTDAELEQRDREELRLIGKIDRGPFLELGEAFAIGLIVCAVVLVVGWMLG